MAADPILYCLEHVTDNHEFERLCVDLMAREGYPSIDPLGGYHDRGRDALYTDRSTGETTIFAFSVRKDWLKKLREDASCIHDKGHTCARLVFVTTQQVSTSYRDRAVEEIKRKFGWELELFSRERLRLLLTKHVDVIRAHPAIFTPGLFPETPATLVSFKNQDEILKNPHHISCREAGFEFRWTSSERLGERLSSGWDYFTWPGPDGQRLRACLGNANRPGNVLLMRKGATGKR